MYEETVAVKDCEYMIAASTHYIGHARYALRTRTLSGKVTTYLLDAPAFEHLRTMIENSIIEGLSDLGTDAT